MKWHAKWSLIIHMCTLGVVSRIMIIHLHSPKVTVVQWYWRQLWTDSLTQVISLTTLSIIKLLRRVPRSFKELICLDHPTINILQDIYWKLLKQILFTTMYQQVSLPIRKLDLRQIKDVDFNVQSGFTDW